MSDSGQMLALCATCADDPRLGVGLGGCFSLPDQQVRELVRDALTAYCFDQGDGGLIRHAEQRAALRLEQHGVQHPVGELIDAARACASRLGLTAGSSANLAATRSGVLAGHLGVLVWQGGAGCAYSRNSAFALVDPATGASRLFTLAPPRASALTVAEGPVLLAKAALAVGRAPFNAWLPDKVHGSRVPNPAWMRRVQTLVRERRAALTLERKSVNRLAAPLPEELLWKERVADVARWNRGDPVRSSDVGLAYTAARYAQLDAESWADLAWDVFVHHARRPMLPYQTWGFQTTGALVLHASQSCRAALLKLLGGRVTPGTTATRYGSGRGTVVNGEEFSRAIACLGMLLGEAQYELAADIVRDLVNGNRVPWPAQSNRGSFAQTQRAFQACSSQDIWDAVQLYEASTDTPSLWAWQGRDWSADIPKPL